MSLPITPLTKLSRLFKLAPDTLEYIISLNPHDFARLRNPLMFKLMPPRITLARVARMTGTPLVEMLRRIYGIAGIALGDEELAELVTLSAEHDPHNLPANPPSPPNWVTPNVSAIVDLPEADDRLDTDPFVPLFPVIKHSKPGDVILLKHRWEPQPLYDVWKKLDIDYYAVPHSADEWWVYLHKNRSTNRSRN